MRKGFTNNEIDLNLSPANISKALEKYELKTIFKKFQEKLDFDLITYKKTLISNFNEFQRETKNLSETLKEKLEKSSETYKALINEEHAIENKENIIQVFHAHCELMKNVYNEQYNVIREQRIPKFQADSDKILQSIDELSITYEEALKSFILRDMNIFLKQLGDGFAYMDNEYKIMIGNKPNYIDLLLCNLKYNCYVVVELKVTESKKDHLGQIQVYMNYIDKHLKNINQNKTIGIIVCKKDDKYLILYSSDERIKITTYELV